uniref:DNA mismatch repair protein MutS n=1 Tax=Desulfomonile tiedjei TaxID=2358 RepID=A0A7C4ETV5_9BACT
MKSKKPRLDENRLGAEDPAEGCDSPMPLPIDGVLDLHTFPPQEIENLLADYIEACLDARIFDMRIIHGKGTGAMRNRVYAFLSRHPSVQSFQQAPLEAGGWGAVVVRLKKPRCNGQGGPR